MDTQSKIQNPKSAIPCPSCGSSVVVKGQCGACGARLEGRLGVRWTAVPLALLMAAGLIFASISVSTTTPLTPLSSIDERYNYGVVRIAGTVAELPAFGTARGAASLTIQVSDGKATVPARIGGSALEALAREGRVPAFGDAVVVEGSVYSTSAFTFIEVKGASGIVVKPRVYRELSLRALAAAGSGFFAGGEWVDVNGTVRGTAGDLGFARIVTIRDAENNTATLFLPTGGPAAANDTLPLLADGFSVTARGALKWYEKAGMWEVVVPSPADIRVTGGG